VDFYSRFRYSLPVEIAGTKRCRIKAADLRSGNQTLTGVFYEDLQELSGSKQGRQAKKHDGSVVPGANVSAGFPTNPFCLQRSGQYFSKTVDAAPLRDQPTA